METTPSHTHARKNTFLPTQQNLFLWKLRESSISICWRFCSKKMDLTNVPGTFEICPGCLTELSFGYIGCRPPASVVIWSPCRGPAAAIDCHAHVQTLPSAPRATTWPVSVLLHHMQGWSTCLRSLDVWSLSTRDLLRLSIPWLRFFSSESAVLSSDISSSVSSYSSFDWWLFLLLITVI